MLSFATLAVAFLVSALLTWRFCDPASRLHLLDHPNERSLHLHPTPRTGGVAIFVALGVAVGFWGLGADLTSSLYGLGAIAGFVAALSFLDDRKGLPVSVRLPGHLTAATLLVIGGLSLPVFSLPGMTWHWSEWLGVFLSLLFLIWMINLYNFMDGMDGFAAGMAVIGFGCFAVFGWLAGNALFFNLSLIIMAATAGFLIFNFPPARIFMGDVGSSLLGLLAAALSLWGAREGIFPFWAAILVFSPFIVDATATLIRRLFRREKVWQAHKTHYYQRLVQLGWGHRKTVLWEYGLMVACAISTLWTVRQTVITQWLILSIWVVLYSLLMLWIPRLEEKNRKQ